MKKEHVWTFSLSNKPHGERPLLCWKSDAENTHINHCHS